jgi:hypothetical protein
MLISAIILCDFRVSYLPLELLEPCLRAYPSRVMRVEHLPPYLSNVLHHLEPSIAVAKIPLYCNHIMQRRQPRRMILFLSLLPNLDYLLQQ